MTIKEAPQERRRLVARRASDLSKTERALMYHFVERLVTILAGVAVAAISAWVTVRK